LHQQVGHRLEGRVIDRLQPRADAPVQVLRRVDQLVDQRDVVELAADQRDRQVAYVTVAAPLGAEEERRLVASLSAIYGREVTVKQSVNPEVLGGVSVQVGSDLYDGTVLRRLNESRNALAKR